MAGVRAARTPAIPVGTTEWESEKPKRTGLKAGHYNLFSSRRDPRPFNFQLLTFNFQLSTFNFYFSPNPTITKSIGNCPCRSLTFGNIP